MEMSDSTITHESGAKTSESARLDLLPYHGLVRAAARFAKGERRYGHDNWRKGLTNRSYVIERAAHVMEHAAKLIAKLKGHLPDDGDDDAGAIAWGGMFLCEAMEALAVLGATEQVRSMAAQAGLNAPRNLPRR